MREILFRAKMLDNGEWIEGNYICIVDKHYIFKVEIGFKKVIVQVQPDLCAVIPKTVGQYTGLPDKNGKKIFEGDIVLYENYTGIVKFGKYGAYDDYGYYIYFINGYVSISNLIFWVEKGAEVIGNIYDNPELLEVK